MKIEFLLIVGLLLISCNKAEKNKISEKYDKNGNRIIYNEQVYVEMWTKNRDLKVTIVDTFCINQKKRAFRDIKAGKLIFFGYNNYEFKNLSKMLKKYGIESEALLRRGVRIGGFEPYCYQNEMNREIDRRFGERFIDSISELARKEFVLENPEVEYILDGVDLRKKYNIK